MPLLIGNFNELLVSKADYIQLFSLFGMNSEGWLLAELLHFLWAEELRGNVKEFQPQKTIIQAENKRQLHDVWLRVDNTELLCELKSFCTNYCGSPGKNITDRIDDILEAMNRVQKRCEKESSLPLVLALLYPFCDGEAEKRACDHHLRKLMSGSLPSFHEYKIPLPGSDTACARLLGWTIAHAGEIAWDTAAV